MLVLQIADSDDDWTDEDDMDFDGDDDDEDSNEEDDDFGDVPLLGAQAGDFEDDDDDDDTVRGLPSRLPRLLNFSARTGSLCLPISDLFAPSVRNPRIKV